MASRVRADLRAQVLAIVARVGSILDRQEHRVRPAATRNQHALPSADRSQGLAGAVLELLGRHGFHRNSSSALASSSFKDERQTGSRTAQRLRYVHDAAEHGEGPQGVEDEKATGTRKPGGAKASLPSP
jgi:hypothetical protein